MYSGLNLAPPISKCKINRNAFRIRPIRNAILHFWIGSIWKRQNFVIPARLERLCCYDGLGC